MLPPILELVATPLITGAVGYLTNKLAIKMLFRPYEPRWYTFGWQGIVPRTRPVLAKKVGKMVGTHLLLPQDLENALTTPAFQAFAMEKVAIKLKNITHDDIINFIPIDRIKKILDNNAETLNPILNSIFEKVMDNETFKAFIASKAADAVASDDTMNNISSEISLRINNFIHSGKTFEETLPSALLAQKDKITDYISLATQNAIKQTGRSLDVKNAAAEKVIEFKNSFFSSSGADQFKMGMFSMFIDDETIANAVKRELPSILDGIIEQPSVRAKIQLTVNSEVEKLLKMTLSELTAKIGTDTLHSLYSALKTNMTSAHFKSETKDTVSAIVGKMLTSENIVNNLNLEISAITNSIFDKKMVDNLCLIATKCILNNAEDIANALISKGTATIKDGIRPTLEQLDIGGMVERRINFLKLSEVEDVLFSFMRSHFKWINILGFVIGFIIGGLQTVATILSN